ncbi:MAG TPA: O-antigen ligase family protein [Actinomycetota bacterium]|nr:O-antigen ligase family protein [Actinomycetota bacterium]
MLQRLDRLPSTSPGRGARVLWALTIAAILTGIGGWATQTLVGGVIALWSFCVAAALIALVLPLPAALVSPLYMGVAGWLVDMLPLVILVGWTAVVLRWAYSLLREKRLPRGGRFAWVAIAVLVWTGLGVAVITRLDFKHFLLLLGIQFLSTGAILACVDALEALEDRARTARGLLAFVILLSVAVLMQWVGIDIEALQNGETRKRVEVAYGVDAFPNNIGMIKYARSKNAGSIELRQRLESVAADTPEMPEFEVFRPGFQAFENSLVVRFEGSARDFEGELAVARVELLYDNIGLSPANTVPRMRSFPRNALTYAGICAALFPLAFFFLWTDDRRRRRFGVAAACACLFGAGFSLARGSWVAIALGVIYLAVDGVLTRNRMKQVVLFVVAGAVVLTGTYLVKYKVDPLTGRAGGSESIVTRQDLYKDTLGILKGPVKYIFVGYGTERPRTESGTVKEGNRYVPRAGTHSTYLNYLFRTGLPGALLIMALYAMAFLHTRARAKERGPEEPSTFSTLTAASCVTAAAHGVILSLYVEPIYTLTISLLLGIAAANGRGVDSPLLPWVKTRAER